MPGFSWSTFLGGRVCVRRAPSRLALAPLFLLAIESLIACSTIKIAYTNADRILFQYVDEYLNLTATQKQFLRPELEARLDKHRREELPSVIAWLEKISEYGKDGLTRGEAKEILETLSEIYADTTRRTIEVVSPVLAQLNAAQIEHLSQKLTQANRRYQSKYLAYSPDRRKARRARQIIRRIEPWTGDLSSEQKQLVTDLGEAMPEADLAWYAYRQRQQRTALELLRKPASRDELSRFLNQWWVEQGNMSPQLSTKVSQTWKVIEDMVVLIDGTLTPEQRNRVLQRIDDIQRQLRALEN